MRRSAVMLARALVLGFVGGALIGELAVLVLLLVVDDRMQSVWIAGPVLLIGGLIGAADGLLVLPVLLLLDRPLRRCMPLASVVGGLAAATPPLLAIWQLQTLRYLLGMILLPGIAFLAGSALTWPVLTGRPCRVRKISAGAPRTRARPAADSA